MEGFVKHQYISYAGLNTRINASYQWSQREESEREREGRRERERERERKRERKRKSKRVEIGANYYP